MIKINRLMSFGLLPIRIIAGIGFIMNGLPKLANITVQELSLQAILDYQPCCIPCE
jgi:hypothetical protein